MKRYKSGGTNGIPSIDGRESNAAAARVRTNNDVVKAHQSVLIQPRIEKPKRALALRNAKVIKQRDYACHRLEIGGQLGV